MCDAGALRRATAVLLLGCLPLVALGAECGASYAGSGEPLLFGGVKQRCTAGCRPRTRDEWSKKCSFDPDDFHATCTAEQRATNFELAKGLGQGAILQLSPCDLLPYLRRRTLWIIGDSHSKTFYRALQCFLFDFWTQQECRPGANPLDVEDLRQLPARQGASNCIHLTGPGGGRICMVEAVLGNYLVNNSEVAEGGVLPLLRKRFARPEDLFSVQFGTWHRKTGKNWATYIPALQALGTYFQETRAAWPHLLFSETPASHPPATKNGSLCQPARGYLYDSSTGLLEVTPEARSGVKESSWSIGATVTEQAWQLLDKYELPIVAVFNLSLPLFDNHPGPRKRTAGVADCTHMCSPGVPEVWLWHLYEHFKAGSTGIKPLPVQTAAAGSDTAGNSSSALGATAGVNSRDGNDAGGSSSAGSADGGAGSGAASSSSSSSSSSSAATTSTTSGSNNSSNGGGGTDSSNSGEGGGVAGSSSGGSPSHSNGSTDSSSTDSSTDSSSDDSDALFMQPLKRPAAVVTESAANLTALDDATAAAVAAAIASNGANTLSSGSSSDSDSDSSAARVSSDRGCSNCRGGSSSVGQGDANKLPGNGTLHTNQSSTPAVKKAAAGGPATPSLVVPGSNATTSSNSSKIAGNSSSNSSSKIAVNSSSSSSSSSSSKIADNSSSSSSSSSSSLPAHNTSSSSGGHGGTAPAGPSLPPPPPLPPPKPPAQAAAAAAVPPPPPAAVASEAQQGAKAPAAPAAAATPGAATIVAAASKATDASPAPAAVPPAAVTPPSKAVPAAAPPGKAAAAAAAAAKGRQRRLSSLPVTAPPPGSAGQQDEAASGDVNDSSIDLSDLPAAENSAEAGGPPVATPASLAFAWVSSPAGPVPAIDLAGSTSKRSSSGGEALTDAVAASVIASGERAAGNVAAAAAAAGPASRARQGLTPDKAAADALRAAAAAAAESDPANGVFVCIPSTQPL